MRRVAAVGLLLGVLGVVAGCGRTPTSVRVTIRGESFVLDVADNPESRRIGLMGRTEIPPGTGMIFLFARPAMQAFWMGHCLTDMDIIYLDSGGHVTATYTMRVEPPMGVDESEAAYQTRLASYSSRSPAQFVIEVPAGTVERLGIEREERIALDLAGLKSRVRTADGPESRSPTPP